MTLAQSDDDKFQYSLLTQEYLEDAQNVMRKAFFQHENVCIAVGLPQHLEAIAELEELTLRAARDGVTVIAIEKATGKVVGAAFNKLQIKDSPGEDTYFENFAKSCKHSSSKGVVQFMIEADATCNLFEHCNVDCLLEIMFLATLPEYRGNGIAKKLCEVSIEIAKKLLNGENIKQSIDGKKLQREPVPKIVSAIFTSFISQKIGRQLDFEIATITSYEKFIHEGKTFASVIGNQTPNTTLEYKRL